jgi:hypothetical protein
MLANGIKQTTTSTGTGNLALAAVASYPKMSDAFAIGALLSYVLLDSGGLLLETGIGYLLDATTLVRAKVCATLVAGVYNASNPTPVNLSGTTTVDVTPHAATLESMLPTVDQVTAGVLRFLTTAGRNGNFTTQSINSLRVHYMPFLLRAGSPVVSMMANVSTPGAAGTVFRLGIYSCNEKGYMGRLLATSGDMDGASSGQKVATLAAPLVLPPGWYFVAIVCSVSVSFTANTAGNGNIIGGTPFGLNSALTPIDIHYETVASAVLPVTPDPNTAYFAGNTHNPLVYLGVA